MRAVMSSPKRARTGMQRDNLVVELVDRWVVRMAPLPWAERLHLLADIHEQLLEDLADLKRYAELSPHFIAGLIDRLGRPPCCCEEQAHIYANSADQAHRAASGEWFANARANKPAPAGAASALSRKASIDRRRAPRIIVDRPATLMASGRPMDCRLVDISTSGAGVELQEALRVGSRIEIELPHRGKAAGNVVRAEPPCFGLAFLTPIAPETIAALH